MVAADEHGDFYMAEVLNIDEHALSEGLKGAIADAMNLSINASYPTEANITILLSSAYRQADSLAKNGGLYSELSLESLLATAVLQANAIPQGTQEGSLPLPQGSGNPENAKEEPKSS